MIIPAGASTTLTTLTSMIYFGMLNINEYMRLVSDANVIDNMELKNTPTDYLFVIDYHDFSAAAKTMTITRPRTDFRL